MLPIRSVAKASQAGGSYAGSREVPGRLGWAGSLSESPFLHAFNKHLSSAFYVSSTLPSSGNRRKVIAAPAHG